MILRTGVDLIEISRVQAVIERNGMQFMNRVFTAAEQEKYRDSLPSLAARWAAKEAVAKVFCTGIGDVSFQEIEILSGERSEPKLILHGAAEKLAAELNLTNWSISLSHTKTHAIAMVVALGE